MENGAVWADAETLEEAEELRTQQQGLAITEVTQWELVFVHGSPL